ncbi:MAG TPA: hypothetical protein VFB58_05390 [Chloroflexota bacterium]|nr:hypothetical protein [Chloroflexota bacterium]
MKLLLEFALAIVFHPVAVVLAWINIASRHDLDMVRKLIWAIVVLVWGIGPILYIIVDDGQLW